MFRGRGSENLPQDARSTCSSNRASRRSIVVLAVMGCAGRVVQPLKLTVEADKPTKAAILKSIPKGGRALSRDKMGPRYHIQIVEPDQNRNYEILRVQPDPRMEYKMQVIDPRSGEVENNLSERLQQALPKTLSEQNTTPSPKTRPQKLLAEMNGRERLGKNAEQEIELREIRCQAC